jgi:hypothetical protein
MLKFGWSLYVSIFQFLVYYSLCIIVILYECVMYVLTFEKSVFFLLFIIPIVLKEIYLEVECSLQQGSFFFLIVSQGLPSDPFNFSLRVYWLHFFYSYQ